MPAPLGRIWPSKRPVESWLLNAMEGFDYGRAKIELSIPNDFDVNAMIAIGRRAPADNLPDKYREMELPSPRRPLHEIVFEGAFGRQIPGLP